MKRLQPEGPSAPTRRSSIVLSVLFVWLLVAGLASAPLHGSIPRDRPHDVASLALIEGRLAAEPLASAFPPARLELGISEGDAAILRRVLVRQNPWSAFDPEGLSERKSGQGVVPSEKVHHKVPFSSWDKHNLPKGVQEAFNGGESVIGTHSGGESHNFTGHGEYNRRVDGGLQKYIKESGHPGGLSAKAQKEWADNFVKQLSSTEDKYIKGFNEVVGSGRTAVKRWSTTEGANIVKSEVSALRRLGRFGGEVVDHGKRLLKVASVLMTVSEFNSKAKAEGVGQAINDTAEELINPIGMNSREMKDVHRKAYSGFWDFLSPGSDDEENDRWNTLPENRK